MLPYAVSPRCPPPPSAARLDDKNAWALILAAGEGSRLKTLTMTPSGAHVPKQFCSLLHGPSLVQEALNRARTVVSGERVCAIVADQHRPWWTKLRAYLPNTNVIVQPENRGTAIGILLAVTHIAERDRDARVVLLPSDHYVQDESTLSASLHCAIGHLRAQPDEIVLLGLAPDEPDPELGYIVPGARTRHGMFEVLLFVEKPTFAHARKLIENGALLNAFIVAATAQAALSLLAKRFPEIVTAMRDAVQRDMHRPQNPIATAELYASLPNLDFSRHVLGNDREANLRVLPVPHCGWSDLGTSKRLAETVRQVRSGPCLRESSPGTSSSISLAARLDGLQSLTTLGGTPGRHAGP
jgi:mannose-1-phosphate guanylyltransferase